MDRPAIFAATGRERRAVADLLESLDERQLATPSLCAGWDVRTVAAHLAAGVALSWTPWLAAVVRQAGHLHRANDAVARCRWRGDPWPTWSRCCADTPTARLRRRWSDPEGR